MIESNGLDRGLLLAEDKRKQTKGETAMRNLLRDQNFKKKVYRYNLGAGGISRIETGMNPRVVHEDWKGNDIGEESLTRLEAMEALREIRREEIEFVIVPDKARKCETCGKVYIPESDGTLDSQYCSEECVDKADYMERSFPRCNLEVDGFEETTTGGNCEALTKTLSDGRYFLITDANDGSCIPKHGASEVMVGFYDSNGAQYWIEIVQIKDLGWQIEEVLKAFPA